MPQANRLRRFRFSDAVGFGGFVFWRGLERCLSVDALHAVARAVYLGRAIRDELFKRPGPPRDEPEWLRAKSNCLRARIRRRVQNYLNHLLKDFPDRLASPKWRGRCRLEGMEYLEAARQAKRPVVLAVFHFGPVYLSRVWARAHGIPVAAFVHGERETRKWRARYPDRLSPFPGVPIFLYARDIRAVTKFLAAGNNLIIAADTVRGRHTTVETGDGWTLEMNSGPARLAHGAGGDLMLCSIVNEGPWRFRMKFSAPTPGEELRTEADWAAANRRILAATLLDFKAYPDQFDFSRRWKREKTAQLP